VNNTNNYQSCFYFFFFYILSTVHPNKMIVFFFTNFMCKFFILIHLLHSSTCFEHYCAHPQEDNCISTASGIVTPFGRLFSTQVTRGVWMVHGTICTVHTNYAAALKTTTHPKTRCRKPYAATQHLILLMMGVCTRNMSS